MNDALQPSNLVSDLLPFPLYPFQSETVNTLAPLPRAALYWDPGVGKTAGATAIALYKLRAGDVSKIIVLVPPAIILQWVKFLRRVKGLSVVAYRGTPAERRKIDIVTPTAIVMSYVIFKKDYSRLCEQLSGRMLVIADEAQCLKNVDTDNHRLYRDFTLTEQRLLLSGTPISSPADGYGMISLVNPGLYRNLSQFERVHVAERDFFGKVTGWANLDLLHENLALNASRILKEDVLKDLPAVTYQEMYYDLEPQHAKLYKRICDEQIAKLPDGGKIDLTSATALLHALLQIPMNGDHFSGGAVESTGLKVIEEVLDELGDKKLVVVTLYKMTTRRVTEHFKHLGAVSIYGETTARQRADNVDRFIRDRECRLLVIQVIAGGVGIDGLQEVCSDMLFAELPWVAASFHQAVARLHRNGQHLPVTVRIALAENTLQKRVWDYVQGRDELVNLCLRGVGDLRAAVAGK